MKFCLAVEVDVAGIVVVCLPLSTDHLSDGTVINTVSHLRQTARHLQLCEVQGLEGCDRPWDTNCSFQGRSSVVVSHSPEASAVRPPGLLDRGLPENDHSPSYAADYQDTEKPAICTDSVTSHFFLNFILFQRDFGFETSMHTIGHIVFVLLSKGVPELL